MSEISAKSTSGIDGRMMGPMTDDTQVSAAANAGGYLPSLVIIVCISLPEAAASASAEPDMLARTMACRTFTCAKPAAEAPDDRVAEAQQPVQDAAGAHERGGEDEQQDGEQQLARHHAVQQLLGRRSHVDAGKEHPEDGATDIAKPIGSPIRLNPTMATSARNNGLVGFIGRNLPWCRRPLPTSRRERCIRSPRDSGR